MGTRPYAKACVSLMDPTGSLFADRILSRDDVLSTCPQPRKNLKRIFPHSDKMVLVLDDRGDVWEWSDNLVMIRPFVFFDGVADLNTPGDAGRTRVDAGAEDCELERAWAVIRAIHARFFVLADASVKPIVQELKSQVLAGCCLVFSGLFPASGVHDPVPDVCQLAAAYGASVAWALSDQATHLVCAKAHSEKHRLAAHLGIHVVRPEWLWESCWAWRRLSETDFALGPDSLPEPRGGDDELVAGPLEVKRMRTSDSEDDLEWLDAELAL